VERWAGLLKSGRALGLAVVVLQLLLVLVLLYQAGCLHVAW